MALHVGVERNRMWTDGGFATFWFVGRLQLEMKQCLEVLKSRTRNVSTDDCLLCDEFLLVKWIPTRSKVHYVRCKAGYTHYRTTCLPGYVIYLPIAACVFAV